MDVVEVWLPAYMVGVMIEGGGEGEGHDTQKHFEGSDTCVGKQTLETLHTHSTIPPFPSPSITLPTLLTRSLLPVEPAESLLLRDCWSGWEEGGEGDSTDKE